MILLVIGVTCLQIFLDKGQDWDWFRSPEICVLSVGALVAFIYLIIHEVWNRAPFLNVRLFSIPSFALSIFCLATSISIYYGTITLTPLWLQEAHGYNAVWAGIAIAAQGISPVLLIPFIPPSSAASATSIRLSLVLQSWICLLLPISLHHRCLNPAPLF